ncbi:MAG: hypothetical protein P8101_07520 [Candidatus Thiodiazotropha sp.]
MPEWRLKVAKGLIPLPFTELRNRTKTETDLIQQLYDSKSNVVSSYLALDKFNRIVSSSGTDNEINAFRVADQYFPRVDDQGAPIPGGNDGHNDAFRHAFYSAMLTKEFGVGFSAAFGTAHEGLPGNEADREARGKRLSSTAMVNWCSVTRKRLVTPVERMMLPSMV